MSIYFFDRVEKQVYNSICAAIQNSSTRAEIPAIAMDKALDIYKKALSESLQGYRYNQNQIKMRSVFLSYEIEFELCAEFDNGQIQTDIRVIPEIAEIMNMARKEKTVYEAIKTVYTYFVNSFEYAYDKADNTRYHSAISVFLYRKSVCEGFALALANVLNRLGIPCGIITGYSEINGVNGAHAWNIVELDKKYYHLDVTWDICTKNKGSGLFDYFLLDDTLAQKDHRWSDIHVPHATDSTKELYAYKGLRCSTEQECIRVIVSGLKQRKSSIDFRLTNRNHAKIRNEDARRYFETAAGQGCFAYRSISYSVNSTCGTVHFSVNYQG